MRDMTENTKNAMIAINKWFYYGMNYNVVPVEIADYQDCFNAFPKHLRGHLFSKWESLYESYGSRAVLMAFYAELDGTNRKRLMEWVLENYNDECKLSFKEED